VNVDTFLINKIVEIKSEQIV